jgi:hypothetical protein
LSAGTDFNAKEHLGLLDGLHNGFAMPGAVVANYFLYIKVAAAGQWNTFDAYSGSTAGAVFLALLCLFLVLVGMVIGFFLHLLFYFALFIKLFFVATTPLYHLGLLLGFGVTWALFAASASAQEGENTTA